jgi:hypothetical protein
MLEGIDNGGVDVFAVAFIVQVKGRPSFAIMAVRTGQRKCPANKC